MKFIISGKEYDAEAGAAKASLQTLYVMKTKYGIGVKSLVAMAKKFKTFKNPIDILDDDEAFNAFRALIWLARIQVGEKLTMDEACDFPLDEMTFMEEDGEDPDPKASEDSAPDEGPPPSTPSTKTTSKRRSTPTS